MPKKAVAATSGGRSSGRSKQGHVTLDARSRDKAQAPWRAMSVGGFLALLLGWWASREHSKAGTIETSDEAPLQPDVMLGSMKRIEEQELVSLADVGLQLRFFCGEELDTLLASAGGPPTRQPPRTSTCTTFVKMLPRIEKVVSLQAPTLGSPLSDSAAQHFDRRLLGLARLEVDYDAVQALVLQLAQWMHDNALGWPRSLTTLLTVHLVHGDDQPYWEQELTRIRSESIADLSIANLSSGSDITFLAAVACQAKLTDYAWRELPRESDFVSRAAASLGQGPEPTNESVRTLLVAVGSYQSFLPLVEQWSSLAAWRTAYESEKDKAERHWPFWQLWRLVVEEPLAHRFWREKLSVAVAERGSSTEVGTKVEGSASFEVRAMYERNPYPSWSWMHPPLDWPPKLFDWLRSKHWQVPDDWPTSCEEKPKVLVAGCGTGHWMTHFARHYKNQANVWALDLSLSSLAFTARRLEENKLTNVHLEQADILDLPEVVKKERPFDFIEVGGVLHHLMNPETGWTRLVELLRPGGVMLVALYSKIARRQGVDPCREFARKGGYNASSAWSLRRYRADVMKQRLEGHRWAQQITTSKDFVSLSGVRDLCLHVQETQYTMLEIEDMLGRLGLLWLGMAETVSEDKQRLFKSFAGTDAFSEAATPSLWHRFEEKHPTTFLGMYEFFVQKRTY